MKVYFKTFGCSTNFSETEVMKGQIVQRGDFQITDNEENAYVIIVSICTVKTDNLALKEIKRITNSYPNKKLVVAGCIPKHLIREIRKINPDAGMISTHNVKDILTVVEETINDNPTELLTFSNEIKINLPKVRKNKVVGIIPISNSCVGNCTYCSVKVIKGKFHSYAIENIVKEVQCCLEDGCREIWLTAQDTGCYGKDINVNLIDLLKEITKINKNFKIRLGMANPNHIKKFTNELIEIYKDKKFFKFLHIPVQSGNDDILKKMTRGYSVDDFKEIVAKFRKEIPEITISTDIICGFPGETKEQFADSIKLIEEIKPDVLNISRFRSRPGTAAAKMEALLGEEAKDRSRHLTSTFDWIAFEQNKKWGFWEGQVLIDERGKEKTWVGRNYCYKPIVVKGNLQLGDIVNVKITGMTKHDLRGEVI